ncbi:MAG: sulfatase [Luteolibacter sp.]
MNARAVSWFIRCAFGLLATIPALLAADRPNLLLICIDDLRPELPSFGQPHIHAPEMEKLFGQGRLFKQHYVQAPTCGASRYALLTGLRRNPELDTISNESFRRHDHASHPSFPALLRSHGYLTASIGKVSHYPGNRRGNQWSDPKLLEIPNAWDQAVAAAAEWRSPLGLMHGYANGVGRKRGISPPFEAATNARYPDDAIVDEFKIQLQRASRQDKPWFIAVGLLRPHLPFACDQRFLDLYRNTEFPEIEHNSQPGPTKEWHASAELLNGYRCEHDPRENDSYAKQLRKFYAACVSSTDEHVGEILTALEKSGLSNNTIVVLWSDHGWHLGEHKIWGKHTLYPIALRSPLFIKSPGIKQAGTPSEEIVESVDVYPTLCHLTHTPAPAGLDGQNLAPILADPRRKSRGKAISYWQDRMSIISKDGQQIVTRDAE